MRRHWILLTGLLFAALVIAYVTVEVVATLNVLSQVERERDSWQRPSDVLDALDLQPGSQVADVGSGAGYFALKIASLVGPRGRVLAVDLRRVSLAFLWIRALQAGHQNLDVIHGETNNPRLPVAGIDRALIANTYHEFENPAAMLAALHRSLKPAGGLVVLDRGPRPDLPTPHEQGLEHHERPMGAVEDEMHRAGFDTISRDERFIDRPEDDHIWWLLVMRRTGA